MCQEGPLSFVVFLFLIKAQMHPDHHRTKDMRLGVGFLFVAEAVALLFENSPPTVLYHTLLQVFCRTFLVHFSTANKTFLLHFSAAKRRN